MKTKIILFTLFFGTFDRWVIMWRWPRPTPPLLLLRHRSYSLPEQKLELRLAHVAKRLKLTDAQTDQLHTIWQQSAPQIEADRSTIETATPGTPARKTARAQLAADLKARDLQLKTVLTPDQQRKFITHDDPQPRTA